MGLILKEKKRCSIKLTPKLFDYISDWKYKRTSFDFQKIALGICSAKTLFCHWSLTYTFAPQFSH